MGRAMNIIRIAIIMAITLSHFAYTDTTSTEQKSVARLYLEYRVDGWSYDAKTGFSIIRRPYYGITSDYMEKVKYFGQNIAKEMEPVPEAKRIMNGYKIHAIGTITGIALGIGTIVAAGTIGLQKGSKQKPDGTYETKVPAGIPIGFALIGTGLILSFTKPIYLRAAVNEYNRHAIN